MKVTRGVIYHKFLRSYNTNHSYLIFEYFNKKDNHDWLKPRAVEQQIMKTGQLNKIV